MTFGKVSDELRRKTALHYLGGKKAPVNETACLVGLSDPAAFSRAFEGDGFSLTRTNLCPVPRPECRLYPANPTSDRGNMFLRLSGQE